MLIYRASSGQLIDLWSLPPHHLVTAGRIVARIINARRSKGNVWDLLEESSRQDELVLVLNLLSQDGILCDAPWDTDVRRLVIELTGLGRTDLLSPERRAEVYIPAPVSYAHGRFGRQPRMATSFGQARRDLAVSRLVRAHLARIHDPGLPVPGWRNFRAEHSDLAWAIVARDETSDVEEIASRTLALLGVHELRAPIETVLLSGEQSQDPLVRIAFHLGLYDAQGLLPILLDPGTLYDLRPDTSAMDSGTFFFREPLQEEDLPDSSTRWFPAPGSRRLFDKTILEEADELRKHAPFAVWVATGGTVQPER